MVLNLTILGTPIPKQSARFKRGRGGRMESYQKQSVKNSARSIALQVKSKLPKGFKPFDKPIGAEIVFVFPPLKKFSQKKLEAIKAGEIVYKDTRPDNDNLAKNLFDPM